MRIVSAPTCRQWNRKRSPLDTCNLECYLQSLLFGPGVPIVPDLPAFQNLHDDVFDPAVLSNVSRVRIDIWDRYAVGSQEVHRSHIARYCKALWSSGRVRNAGNKLRAVMHRDLEDD
jgi:hypothetical protein